MKKIISLLTVAVLLLGLAACGTPSDETSQPADSAPESVEESVPTETAPTLTISAIQGPTGVGLVNLMAADTAKTAVLDYEFTVCTTPQEAMTKLTNGDVLLASVPTNVAATLYNKTNGGIRILAINTGNVLSILENGNTIQSVADLKGKTIYSTGQGANPEYVLRHLLTKNGLDPDKDVTIEFLAENTELATMLASGKASVALVPQPVATTAMLNNQALRVALDVGAEWARITTDGSQPVMGCLIAKADTVAKYPQTIATFLTEYEASIKAANADVATTATHCETYGIIAKAAVAKAAIPHCGLQFTAGADMQKLLQGYYEVLFNANPSAVGGAVPEAAFYYVP